MEERCPFENHDTCEECKKSNSPCPNESDEEISGQNTLESEAQDFQIKNN